MRRLLVIGLAAAATSSPAVPLRAQQAIRVRVEPLLAYVPSSLPAGYHYARWMQAHSRPRGLTIWFRWRRLRDPGLGFNVAEGCPEFGEPMKTYRFGRVSVRWSTTYTDAQARRGEGLFQKRCASCHLQNGWGPPLRGNAFWTSWDRKSARSLYSTIISSMPPDDPGSLTEKNVIDTVAYIFRINRLSPGTKEIKTAADLNDVQLARPK